MSRLYHKDIWMPVDLIEQSFYLQKNLKYAKFTNHVKQNLLKHDWHHFSTKKEIIYVINQIINNPIIPFEIEEDNNIVTKYAIKFGLNKKDLILVFRGYKLITFYTNYKNDNHINLNDNKYVKIKY